MFSILPKANFKFLVTFDLSSANAFNLEKSKILSFGKDVRGDKIQVFEIVHHYDIISTENLLSMYGETKTRGNVKRNYKMFEITEQRKNCFTCRAINTCNSLPQWWACRTHDLEVVSSIPG